MDFCCRDDICELAIFSRGFHCYGVSCDEPELCHKILDHLLMEDERQLQRSTRNTGEVFRRKSQSLINQNGKLYFNDRFKRNCDNCFSKFPHYPQRLI